MALPFYNWSRTAASNATADSTVNWAEGQAPSSVNDSARAMMASTAAYRDDIAGAIATGGTSTAYTVTSYQIFDSLAHLNGQLIAFTPHATNGATVTLNVDGLGYKPLRSAPSTELLAGTLVQGTPYLALYNSSDAVFYLHGFYGNPYNVPLGAGLEYWLPTAPNSSFVFPIGQAISRTTYATLFAQMSTTYGVGDGSTTFNLPDKRGRVSAMKETAATNLTSSYFGTNSTALGATGGAESTTLTAAQIPTITSANASQAINLTSSPGVSFVVVSTAATASFSATAGSQVFTAPAGVGTSTVLNPSTTTNSISVTSNNTSGNAHRTVPPMIICNYILRIL